MSASLSTDWLRIVAYVVSAIGGITGVFKDRPRVIAVKHLENFINYEKEEKVTEKEFEIKWGFIDYTFIPLIWLDDEDGKLKRTSRMRDILLDEVQENSTLHPLPYYYPTESLDTTIPEFAYKTSYPKNDKKKIYLINRKFYRKEHIEKVYVTVKTPLDSSFKENISGHIRDGFIDVINYNRLDVINYKVNLPDDVANNRVDLSHIHIEDLVFEEEGNKRVVVIKRIPGKTADQPGRIKIPLR